MRRKTSVVVISQNDAGSCAAIGVIINMITESGSRVILVDATQLQPKTEIFERYKFLRIFYQFLRSDPVNFLTSHFSNSKITIIRGSKNQLRGVRKEAENLYSVIPNTIERLEHWELSYTRLGRSLASVLCIDIARSPVPQLSKYPVEIRAQIIHFLANYHFLAKVIEQESPDEVVIFNGRRPNTAALVDAAENSGTPLRYFETNWDGRIFLESFSPHDRELVQRKSIDNCKLLTNNELLGYIHDFKTLRKEQLNRNQFIRNFTENPDLILTHKKKIVIFTSSPDEFIGVGDSWKPLFWKNQEEAISRITEVLIAKEVKFVIRMHPNTLNKTWHEYLRQVDFYSSLNAEIIRPESTINSYDLIDASSGVIVWASTTGLESAIRGKPTWTLSPNLYDIDTGIKMISTIEEARAEDFNPYTLNLENLIPSIVGMQRGYSWIDKQVQYFQISNILEIHIAKIFRIEAALDYLLLPALVLFKIKRSPEALSRWFIRVFGEIKAERYWSILTSHWIVAKICKV